jgi:hypothetical protein
MKKNKPSLSLSTETIRSLRDHQLGAAAGGVSVFHSCLASACGTCPTLTCDPANCGTSRTQ